LAELEEFGHVRILRGLGVLDEFSVTSSIS
jgi:hypothetical protein